MSSSSSAIAHINKQHEKKQQNKNNSSNQQILPSAPAPVQQLPSEAWSGITSTVSPWQGPVEDVFEQEDPFWGPRHRIVRYYDESGQEVDSWGNTVRSEADQLWSGARDYSSQTRPYWTGGAVTQPAGGFITGMGDRLEKTYGPAALAVAKMGVTGFETAKDIHEKSMYYRTGQFITQPGGRAIVKQAKSTGRGAKQMVDGAGAGASKLGSWIKEGGIRYVNAQRDINKIRTGWTQDAGKGIVGAWRSIFGKKRKKKKKKHEEEPEEPEEPVDPYPENPDPWQEQDWKRRNQGKRGLIINYGSRGLECGVDIPWELCEQFGD